METEMRGGRWAWLGGWGGSFLWQPLVAIVVVVQEQALLMGVLVWVLDVVAVIGILALAPWRHPDTPLWKLMLPLYGIMAAGALLLVLGFSGTGVRRFLPLLPALLPTLLPLAILGRRSWRFFSLRQSRSPDRTGYDEEG